APLGEAQVVEGGVGDQRGKSAGEVLPADADRQGPAPARAGPVVAAHPRDRTRHEAGAGQGIAAMNPDVNELDEEIRGHLALSIQERIDRGEDPKAARLAALKEFGNVLLTRDAMRSVWRPRWLESVEAFVRDIGFALRSLARAKGLTGTVVVTLALG